MAHMIEQMAFAGETPWHGLGTNVSGLMKAAEAMTKGGLDWTVALQDLFVNGSFTLDGSEQHKAEGFKAVVRQSDFSTLGVVGGKYSPIQNIEAFDFFDAVVASGEAQYETVGSLDGGRRIFAAARLQGDVQVKASRALNDKVEKYVLLTNTHDGSGKFRAFFTGIRPVCANTVNMALKGAGKDGISIRHTASATEKMKEAIRLAAAAKEYWDDFDSTVNVLAETKFTVDNMKSVSEVLFPSATTEVATRTSNNRELLVGLFTAGKGTFGESAWDALNAITEYATHHRTTRTEEGGASQREQKMLSNYWGSGAAFSQKGFETIMTLSGLAR